MSEMKKKEKISEFEEVKIGPDAPIYSTGVVCKLLDIPIWVLKKLDKEGVISPPRDYKGKARLYSKRELKKLEHCWKYINKHKVKIDGLKVILQMESGTWEGE